MTIAFNLHMLPRARENMKLHTEKGLASGFKFKTLRNEGFTSIEALVGLLLAFSSLLNSKTTISIITFNYK